MPGTETLTPDAAGIARAVTIWRRGGLVAFPTETVYGLGADATNGAAVAAIFEAKSRPAFNPLIVHAADLDTARRFAAFGPEAERLANAFWPGPLSLVLPVRAGGRLSPLVTAGLDTVAIRVPDHPLAARLLAAFGGAIAAPSANPSGGLSPTTAAHVLQGLGGRIAAVIDAGPCGVGVESTIVAPEAARLLRPGGLPRDAIEAALGRPLEEAATPQDPPTAPGQLASHYAPGVPLVMNAKTPRAGMLWLGFGPGCTGADANLSPTGDLCAAAAALFAALHRLDGMARQQGKRGIAVAPIPATGLGAAINDRLRRASAPR